MKIILILCLCVSSVWNKPNARIIGGSDAYAGQYKYAAAIYKTTSSGNYFCTGSLLNKLWVITSAQCVDGAIRFTILLGTHKLTGDAETVQRLSTDTYEIHPNYNPETLENDIGLIKFREPIVYNNYIQHLYLPFVALHDTSAGIAFGWGQTSDDNSELSDTLQSVRLARVSDAECRITYGSQLGENMVCFEGNYNEGTCFGDSGSPIIQHVSRGYDVVIAIASFFSSDGCESTHPSGYTQVFPFNEWIRNFTSGVA